MSKSNKNYFQNEFPTNVLVDKDRIFVYSDNPAAPLELKTWDEVTSFTSNLITAANFTFGPVKNYDDEKLV